VTGADFECMFGIDRCNKCEIVGPTVIELSSPYEDERFLESQSRQQQSLFRNLFDHALVFVSVLSNIGPTLYIHIQPLSTAKIHTLETIPGFNVTRRRVKATRWILLYAAPSTLNLSQTGTSI
jgi:hypothetical protein